MTLPAINFLSRELKSLEYKNWQMHRAQFCKTWALTETATHIELRALIVMQYLFNTRNSWY